MSRSLTVIAVAVTAAISFGLYQLSYEVQHLEDELAELSRALVQERENIAVLQAEWAYLTRPEALQDRAQRLLDLQPVTPNQIVDVGDLPTRQERLKLDGAPGVTEPDAMPPRPRPRPLPPIAGAAAAMLAVHVSRE